MIIFGTKGRITTAKSSDVLTGACPECTKDLDLRDLKKWFTLYFIPLFPYSHVDTFYYCKDCKSSYKQEARARLLSGDKGRKQLKEESLKLFETTLIACLSYMAKIDGEISAAEEKMINKLISKFKDNASELEEVYKKVKNGVYAKNDVFRYLREASAVLTADGILMLMASLARMILADGKIEKEEEKLMKDFMLVCGVSDDLYQTILDKVR